MKQKLHTQENESAQLVKHVAEVESNVSAANSELIGKQTSMLKDEASLKRAKQLKTKIESASEKLTVVLDSSLSSSTLNTTTMSNVFENQQITSE
jgi:hypothetical protein